jgi:hypothetical protein
MADVDRQKDRKSERSDRTSERSDRTSERSEATVRASERSEAKRATRTERGAGAPRESV